MADTLAEADQRLSVVAAMLSRMTRETAITLRGPYALEEVALMGFGHRDERSSDGVMRLAFGVDGHPDHTAGVEIRQRDDALGLVVHDGAAGPGGPVDLDVVRRQVARVVSADHDGDAFAQVCAADRVLAGLHATAPGFRPANFHSAYDACVWSVLSARRQRSQAIGLRTRLSQQHGTGFDLAGQRVHALPTPSVLASLDHVDGLQDAAVPRLHAIAAAALDGRLDVDRLASMSPEEAMADLQQLPGIGPFYSSLVVIRALGLTDVLPTQEPRSLAIIQRLYDLDHEPTEAELTELAEGWRPFRTWATVLLRAVGSRVMR